MNTTAQSDATGPHVCRPVTEYGCVRCQKWHRQGLDQEYDDHLFFQSKHGPRDRAVTPDEVLERIGKGE